MNRQDAAQDVTLAANEAHIITVIFGKILLVWISVLTFAKRTVRGKVTLVCTPALVRTYVYALIHDSFAMTGGSPTVMYVCAVKWYSMLVTAV